LKDVDQFDPQFFNISPMEAELMDPQQRLFLEESWKALEDAGYSSKALARIPCGVYAGVMNSDYLGLLFQQSKKALTAHAMTGNDHAILAARIAYYLNLTGPAISINTACSSSLVAMHLACKAIQNGEIAMALVGGVTLYLSENGYIMMSQAGMLSHQGKCRTFDNDADGFVPGEGCGVIVLKSLERAKADRDHIYGVIKGSGINQDGTTNGITAPSSISQTELEAHVYDRYGINPETISYMEAHGTGTKLGDPIEFQALTNAFRKYTNKIGYCGIGSVKSNIGHTSAAAGIASVIKILLAMKHGQIPPTLHFDKKNEHIQLDNSPFYVNAHLNPWTREGTTLRRAAVSSFGVSGTNAHAVIEEFAQPKELTTEGKKPQLIVLSAQNQHCLKESAELLKNWLPGSGSLEEIAYTLQVGREAMDERLAFVVTTKEQLEEKLKLYLQDNVEAVYRGNAKADRTKMEGLMDGAEGRGFVESIVKTKNISKLGKLWVGGVDIDWNILYTEEKPQRISLPT
jgi:polyketide synthase PksN